MIPKHLTGAIGAAPVVTIRAVIVTQRMAQGVYRRFDHSYHLDKKASTAARQAVREEIRGKNGWSVELKTRSADLLDDGTLLLHIVGDSVPAFREPGSRAIELSDHARHPLEET